MDKIYEAFIKIVEERRPKEKKYKAVFGEWLRDIWHSGVFQAGYQAGAEAERQKTPEWRREDYIVNIARQIEKLEQQLEDMKCCGNCKHGKARGQICWLTGNPPAKDPCEEWE